eukprot:205105-Chlamydomonas_euryale.AAC.1
MRHFPQLCHAPAAEAVLRDACFSTAIPCAVREDEAPLHVRVHPFIRPQAQGYRMFRRGEVGTVGERGDTGGTGGQEGNSHLQVHGFSHLFTPGTPGRAHRNGDREGQIEARTGKN